MGASAYGVGIFFTFGVDTMLKIYQLCLLSGHFVISLFLCTFLFINSNDYLVGKNSLFLMSVLGIIFRQVCVCM